MTDTNPFIIKGAIPAEHFCGRDREIAELEMLLTNGHNVVLVAPRRMGKTSLVEQCFARESISGRFNTMTMDILETSSIQEFTAILVKTVFDAFRKDGRVMAEKFLSALRTLVANIGYDPVTNLPTLSLNMGQIRSPEKTIDETFAFLESVPRHNIIMIDEFQQVTEYRNNSTMEAVLRSRIQKLGNTSFVFSGSEPTMINRMFLTAGKPFYRSATKMELAPIDENEYLDFSMRGFASGGRTLEPSAFHTLYALFHGLTYYIHYCMNIAYMMMREGEVCNEKTLVEALYWIISREENSIRQELSALTLNQKRLLYSVAGEGTVEGITSEAFLERNSLPSTSAVQAAAKTLQNKKLLSRTGDRYFLNDKIQELWIIDNHCGGLTSRISALRTQED